MDKTRKWLKPVSLLMAIVMVMIAVPIQPAVAAMIHTEDAIDVHRVAMTRQALHQMLARQDVRQALIAEGIQPSEARQRVDSLTDREIMQVAKKMDALPAGAGFLEVVGFIVVFSFLAMLITDMLGYTNVFPFINPAAKR